MNTWASSGMDMDPERTAVGRERLEAFIGGHAMVQAEAMSLTMSVTTAPMGGYSDAALDAIDTDCRDLITAVHAHVHFCRRLAKEWRQQRQRAERAERER